MIKKNINGLIIILSLIIIGIISYIFLSWDNTIYVEEIILNKNNITLTVGENEKIEVNIEPIDANDKSLIWESENTSVASVNGEGIVEANNIGNTIINIKSKDGNAKSKCFISVEKIKIDSLDINKSSVDLMVGEKEKLTVTITPEELSNDEIIWLSSNSKVAIVNENGEVEAKGQGTATITATSSDGSKNAACVVNVSGPPAILVQDVSIKNGDVILVKGATDTLLPIINPADATDKSIKWSSSNNNIVSVDAYGKIVAHNIGEAIVTVTTTDGLKEAHSNIKVVDVKTFDARNDAIVAYMKDPFSIVKVYNMYNCKSKSCLTPKKYSSSLTGQVNIYQYDISNNTKNLVITTDIDNIDNLLIPNKTFYLESISNKNLVEVVKVVGDLRVMTASGVGNFRDIGGYTTDEGTRVKYGIIYRSASSDSLSEKVINLLNIKEIVDLRTTGQVSSKATDASKKIRKIISVTQYNITSSSNVRKAVGEIMHAVVNENKNVLANCAIGRDRTGTVSYAIEGILGVTLENRKRDYEISYFPTSDKIRTNSSFVSLINQFNKYEKTKYDQETFINWYLSTSSNKTQDLELINDFRKRMIDGNPLVYKLVNDKLTLS